MAELEDFGVESFPTKDENPVWQDASTLISIPEGDSNKVRHGKHF